MRFGPALGFIALILVAVALAAYTSQRHPGDMNTVPPNERPDPSTADQAPATKTPTMTFDQARVGAVKVVMEIDGKGPLTLELYPKAAPKTVAAFVDLCKKGFYDGILFHRVVPNFVVQAGDPTSKNVAPESIRNLTPDEVTKQYKLGTHGSGITVAFEGGALPNVAYTVSMALSKPRTATGDSQFFINLVDNHRLDGDYCVFGKVVGGTDLVSKIQQGDRIKTMKVQ